MQHVSANLTTISKSLTYIQLAQVTLRMPLLNTCKKKLINITCLRRFRAEYCDLNIQNSWYTYICTFGTEDSSIFMHFMVETKLRLIYRNQKTLKCGYFVNLNISNIRTFILPFVIHTNETWSYMMYAWNVIVT